MEAPTGPGEVLSDVSVGRDALLRRTRFELQKCTSGNVSKEDTGSGGEMGRSLISQLISARHSSSSALRGLLYHVPACHVLRDQVVVGLFEKSVSLLIYV